jgi:hypothetical protein
MSMQAFNGSGASDFDGALELIRAENLGGGLLSGYFYGKGPGGPGESAPEGIEGMDAFADDNLGDQSDTGSGAGGFYGYGKKDKEPERSFTAVPPAWSNNVNPNSLSSIGQETRAIIRKRVLFAGVRGVWNGAATADVGGGDGTGSAYHDGPSGPLDDPKAFDIAAFHQNQGFHQTFFHQVVHLHGFFLDGAQWIHGKEHEEGFLGNEKLNRIRHPLPIAKLKFEPAARGWPETCYHCPVFRTALRGQHQSFLFEVNLKMDVDDTETKWVLAGTALLLSPEY